MEQSDIIKDLKESQSAKYHRGKSWEYCYKFFRNYKKFRNSKKLLDQASLHLAFFLASWGMLKKIRVDTIFYYYIKMSKSISV